MKILVADPLRLHRTAMNFAISAKGMDAEVLHAETSAEALAACGVAKIAIAIVAISLADDACGLDASSKIKSISPETKIILTAEEWRVYLLGEAAKSGADSLYCQRTDSFDGLFAAVEAVARGGSYVSPSIGAQLITYLREASAEPLTREEYALILGLRFHRPQAEIFEELKLKEATGRNRIDALKRKVGLTDAATINDLVARARKLGLTNLASRRLRVAENA